MFSALLLLGKLFSTSKFITFCCFGLCFFQNSNLITPFLFILIRLIFLAVPNFLNFLNLFLFFFVSIVISFAFAEP